MSESDDSLEGKKRALAKCASLNDAIHNIPLFINKFENWDQAAFLNILRGHDEKWASAGLSSLEAVYRNELERHGKSLA